MAGRKLLILIATLAIGLTTLLPDEGLAGTTPGAPGVTEPQYMTVMAVKHRRRRRHIRVLLIKNKHHKHHKHHKKRRRRHHKMSTNRAA